MSQLKLNKSNKKIIDEKLNIEIPNPEEVITQDQINEKNISKQSAEENVPKRKFFQNKKANIAIIVGFSILAILYILAEVIKIVF